jgi:hypothetical protein
VSAAAFLAELELAGVFLSRDGHDIRFKTRPGIGIAPYGERIIAQKPALLAELLKREITDTVTVDPAEFDRPAYLRLIARRYAVEAELVAGEEDDVLRCLGSIDLDRLRTV